MSKLEAMKKYIDIVKILAPERFHINYNGANVKLRRKQAMVKSKTAKEIPGTTEQIQDKHKFDLVQLER